MTPERMAATGLDHLTENAIDEILDRLPTKDAVRTSVLSRSWRDRWKSIPDLDLSSVPLAAVDKTLRLHSAPVRHFKLQIETQRALEQQTVLPSFAALALRSSTSLRTIDLSLWCTFRLSTFDQYFPRLTLIKLSDCVIKKLHCTTTTTTTRTIFSDLRTLDINRITFAHDPVDLDSIGCLSIPMYIPACPKLEKLTLGLYDDGIVDLNTIGRNFPRLTHLKLDGNCHLNIVPAALASLRVLHLFNVAVDGKLSVLFSSCPSLEMMSLVCVTLVSEKHLYVAAPNLRWLEVVRLRHGGGNRLHDFSFANSPVLETVSIDLVVYGGGDEEVDESCNLMKVLGGLPRVKKLTLYVFTLEFLQGGHIPEKLPTSLEHLTHMSIDLDFGHIDVAPVVFCLLRSAPNLQQFEFKGRYCEDCLAQFPGDRKNFCKAREHVEPFDSLKTVRMHFIGNYEDELEFELEIIQFVLSKARVLETMMIELMDDTHKESLVRTVLEFPKASHQAQIVFPGTRAASH